MVSRNALADVSSPIDLRSVPDARNWTDTAMAKRPWRTEFFDRIAQELAQISVSPVSVLELGSGPGFLAHHLLSAVPDLTYAALDFSAAMHALAEERLGALTDRVTFIEADFRDREWTIGLPQVDAVVTVQAVHELRHKRHAPSFYRQVRPLLKPGGLFLMCDHEAGDGGMNNKTLFMTRDEHAAALRDGGFSGVELLLQKGGLVLFRARDVA
jgi:cyclopropane fatty-acyl-phospholipid synthase-like methyltransferase